MVVPGLRYVSAFPFLLPMQYRIIQTRQERMLTYEAIENKGKSGFDMSLVKTG